VRCYFGRAGPLLLLVRITAIGREYETVRPIRAFGESALSEAFVLAEGFPFSMPRFGHRAKK
jgi:hypothetical protein